MEPLFYKTDLTQSIYQAPKTMKPVVHVVWFKHDLRVHDHAALSEACKLGAVLPIFTWQAEVWGGADYATQHQCFVSECLHSLQLQLKTIGLSLLASSIGILETLAKIAQTNTIASLHSHEETGNDNTYQLDKAVAIWCNTHAIPWHEYPQNGVVRRLKSRDKWAALWEQRMTAPLIPVPEHVSQAAWLLADRPNMYTQPLTLLQADKPQRQRGGREEAIKLLHTFLHGRASRYRGGISSPLSSECAGSRISPYLTWGVLSMREVVQALRLQRATIQAHPDSYPKGLLAGLAGFESRLHWHCHFMQKLESEPRIEFENLHPAFNALRDESYTSAESQTRLQAWQTGQTGWPLVDACMAMLRETGWVNFRMRAMLMSTASYLLWLHWRQTGLHLAREFLDYEPGIHWSQVQMQSGTTGINTLRIYNPVKQAKDQDPDGVFVRRWLPALRQVSNSWIFQPWLMPEALQQACGCKIGVDYPAPLVDIEQAYKLAKARFSQLKKSPQHYAQTANIIHKHASRKPNSDRQRQRKQKPTAEQLAARQQSLF